MYILKMKNNCKKTHIINLYDIIYYVFNQSINIYIKTSNSIFIVVKYYIANGVFFY